MKKQNNLFDYLLFTAAGVSFLVTLSIFQGNKNLSFITLFGFVVFYICWAIFHHRKTGILQFKNVIEYVLIGLTVLIFVKIIFFRL